MRAWIPAILAVAACNGDNIDGNREPIVEQFDLFTQEDLPVTRTINAIDLDLGDMLTAVAQPPTHGTAAIAGLAVTYQPAPDYHGPDRFAVTISDGVAEVSVTVNVSVASVPDHPIGGADSLATNEDTPRLVPIEQLLANDTDADGDTLTLTSVGNPVNGFVTVNNGMVRFQPAPNFTGGASFIYTITDGTFTEPVLVTVVVAGVNDAPVANDDAIATDEDTPKTVTAASLLVNDTDPDGQVLTIQSVGSASNGTVQLVGSNVTFTPATNFNGTASFTYTVTDGIATDTATVTVLVGSANDNPIAVDDVGTTNEKTPITFSNLVGNDVDPDGPTALAVTAVANATNGTVVLNGGSPIFTPTTNANTNQTGTFEYTVSDGIASDVGLVTITITPVNDPVTAVGDAGTTDEKTPITFSNLVANDLDSDGPALSVTSVSNATNGTVVLIGTSAIFTPTTNSPAIQTGTFEYTVDDGAGSTDTGLVTITITPVNDPPIAAADSISQTGAQTAHAHSVFLANDSDGGDGGALTITAVSAPVNGTVTLQASTITFTPNNGFSGAASFQYTINDGAAASTATVTVTVTAARVCGDGIIEAPETCDDNAISPDDGCSATCTVETGFSCAGAPSVCTEICGDTLVVGKEECDDGTANTDETDGCTTKCVKGRKCNATEFPGGTDFAVDPVTGHCYVSFATATDAQSSGNACIGLGGYQVTITSAEENAIVLSVFDPITTPWIGLSKVGAALDWVTDEPFAFENFEASEPDDITGLCVLIGDLAGQWFDASCVAPHESICEFEANPCGDSVLQIAAGEECDDGNNDDGDGCSATCQLEDGCGDGNLDPGEECDDDNLTSGDGCSSICTKEAPFFSEYVEGTGNNKALEIKNPLATPFDLSVCNISVFNNGSPTVSDTLSFGARSIPANDVFVVCDDAGNSVTLLPLCDLATSDATMNFNGDDTLQLICTIAGVPTVLDTIGDVGFASGQWGTGLNSTIDNTIRRRCTNVATGKVITRGNLIPDDDFDVDLLNEWVGFATDTFSGLGDPTCAP